MARKMARHKIVFLREVDYGYGGSMHMILGNQKFLRLKWDCSSIWNEVLYVTHSHLDGITTIAS